MFNLEDNQYNDIINEGRYFNNNIDDLEGLLHEICHYKFGYDKFPNMFDMSFDGRNIAKKITAKFKSHDHGDRHEAECCVIVAFALKKLGYEKWQEIPDLAFSNISSLNQEMIRDFIASEMSNEKSYTEKAKELLECISNLQKLLVNI